MCVGWWFFFQAEDGIRVLVRSRGLGDVYKRQVLHAGTAATGHKDAQAIIEHVLLHQQVADRRRSGCLLYTSDAADERSSVDLGGRRIIKKQTPIIHSTCSSRYIQTNNVVAHNKNTSKHHVKKITHDT